MKKTVQILMLPTNNRTNSIAFLKDNGPNIEYKHLYFTSNEEIKEGDWEIKDDKIGQIVIHISSFALPNIGSKIIATTDKSLNLPLIPQSFIEEYVKSNGEIKEVVLDWDEVNDYPWFNLDKMDNEVLAISKKQTVEEAAHKYACSKSDEIDGCYLEDIHIGTYQQNIREAFEAGAKWRDEHG